MRPDTDIVRSTSLRIAPIKSSPFIKPLIKIDNTETVNIYDINNGYAKITKNGISGWCNINYLWKSDLYITLRVNPTHESDLLDPPVVLYDGEVVSINEIQNGYAKVIKNGKIGWCDMNNLREPGSYTSQNKCISDNVSLTIKRPLQTNMYNSGTKSSINSAPAYIKQPSISTYASMNKSSRKSTYGCTHRTCIKYPGIGGVGAVIKVRHANEDYVIFGKERFGCNKNKYNVVGGRIDPGECPIEALYREVSEEIKILPISSKGNWPIFDEIFKSTGEMVTVKQENTLIFFGIYSTTKGTAKSVLSEINTNITKANNDKYLRGVEKEMSEVALINKDTISYDGTQFYRLTENTKKNLTDYAVSIFQYI